MSWRASHFYYGLLGNGESKSNQGRAGIGFALRTMRAVAFSFTNTLET